LESTPYMDSVTSARAMLLNEEDALEGATTISLETQQDLQEDDVFTYIQENFPSFLRMLRYLSREDGDMLLSYYILGKTQTTLASIFKSTQTVCSFRIRMAVRVIGAFLIFGEPTEAALAEVLAKASLEGSLKGGLSRAVAEYARCRSFQQVSETLGLHRPDVRRAMSRAARTLMESRENKKAAIGAWVHSLIDKSNPVGSGYSKRKLMKEGHIFRQDSDILGQFVVPIENPDFDQVFVSRANR